MIAINKEAREYLVKLYQETKEKADKTTTEKDKDYFRGVLNTLSATAMEFGFNIVSGNVYDDEALDADTTHKAYLQYLSRWIFEHYEDEFKGCSPAGFDEWLDNEGDEDEDEDEEDEDEDDEDSYDPYEEDMKEYRSMCNDEAHYINRRR